MDVDKGHNFKETCENYSQTEDNTPKPSKILSRLAGKKMISLDLNSSYQISCIPSKKLPIKTRDFSDTVNLVNLGTEKSDRGIHKPEENKVLAVKKPKLYIENSSLISINPSKKVVKFSTSQTLSSSLLPKYKRKIPRLQVSKTTSASLIPKKKPEKINAKSLPIKRLTNSLEISVGISGIKAHKKPEALILSAHKIFSKKITLQITRNPPSSFIGKKVPGKTALQASRKKKPLRNTIEISISIPGIKKIPSKGNINLPKHQEKISLAINRICNREEIEETEVFNALYIHKPDLTISKEKHIQILGQFPRLSIEKSASITCKKIIQKLSINKFAVYNFKLPGLTLAVFNPFFRMSKLEIVILRKFTFLPLAKNTDDEETKSTGGGRKRTKEVNSIVSENNILELR